VSELRERQEGMLQIVEKLTEGGNLNRQMTQQQSLSESKLRREMDGGDSWWMNGNLGAISSNLFL
jgi:hypothetical protein